VDDPVDVVIVGGGPVGSALALALRAGGLTVTVLEARPASARIHDERPLAVGYGSRLILERLGAWDALAPASPIERIHVSQRAAFGSTTLRAAEARVPALGYVIEYGRLATELARLGAAAGARYVHDARLHDVRTDAGSALVEYTVDGITHALPASLAVLADGGGLPGMASKTVDYGQSAVTASVRTGLAHRATAYERFTPDGPLALLPLGERMALVWTTRPERAGWLSAAAPAEFLAYLQQQFGERLGRFAEVEGRACYPLTLKYVPRVTLERTVMVGNAAQTLHPVAGQGLNLGLRDAWELAEEIGRADRGAIGGVPMLAAYRARRRLDRGGGIAFTDALVKLFSNDYPPLRLARGLGLAAFDCLPPVKDFVVRRMTFGARG
jgi:2-octaprenyl-6-methoxyphenol hydroxylase